CGAPMVRASPTPGKIFGALIKEVRFAADSLLEGDGFETLVLRHKTRGFPEHPGIAGSITREGGSGKSPAGPDWRRVPPNITAPLVKVLAPSVSVAFPLRDGLVARFCRRSAGL